LKDLEKQQRLHRMYLVLIKIFKLSKKYPSRDTGLPKQLIQKSKEIFQLFSEMIFLAIESGLAPGSRLDWKA
jgi:hypothetical protein